MYEKKTTVRKLIFFSKFEKSKKYKLIKVALTVTKNKIQEYRGKSFKSLIALKKIKKETKIIKEKIRFIIKFFNFIQIKKY